MTRETLAAILEGEGAKGGDKGLTVPDALEITCFVSTRGEVMSVARLTRVVLKEKYVVMTTAREERFFFVYEDILGVKAATHAASKERGPGFSR